MKKNLKAIVFFVGSLLITANKGQFSYADQNIIETESQSRLEQEKVLLDKQKALELEVDQNQLDTGVVYVATKDTYFYLPEGCDHVDLLAWTVKWMHEVWYQKIEKGINVSAKVFLISEHIQEDRIVLYGITAYESNRDYAGKYAVSATFEKESENTFKFVDYWEPLDSDEIKSIESRFPKEDWKIAEDMTGYERLLLDKKEVTGKCIIVSGDTIAEIIADLYEQIVNNPL